MEKRRNGLTKKKIRKKSVAIIFIVIILLLFWAVSGRVCPTDRPPRCRLCWRHHHLHCCHVRFHGHHHFYCYHRRRPRRQCCCHHRHLHGNRRWGLLMDNTKRFFTLVDVLSRNGRAVERWHERWMEKIGAAAGEISHWQCCRQKVPLRISRWIVGRRGCRKKIPGDCGRDTLEMLTLSFLPRYKLWFDGGEKNKNNETPMSFFRVSLFLRALNFFFIW